MDKPKKVKIEDMPEEFHGLVDSIMGAMEWEFIIHKRKVRERVEKKILEAYEAGLNQRFEAERLAPKEGNEV